MAIKVNNTTVIDDSRNITNIGTATATSFVGDGSGITNLPVPETGTITATASGTLSNGDTIVVNTDGTVSSIVGTGSTQIMGSDATFASAYGWYAQSIGIDTNTILVVYRGTSSSEGSYGYAAVGTITGTSISFGTPVVFNSANTNFTNLQNRVLVKGNNCALITWKESYALKCRGIKVTGTTISLGATVQIHASTRNASVCYNSAAVSFNGILGQNNTNNGLAFAVDIDSTTLSATVSNTSTITSNFGVNNYFTIDHGADGYLLLIYYDGSVGYHQARCLRFTGSASAPSWTTSGSTSPVHNGSYVNHLQTVHVVKVESGCDGGSFTSQKFVSVFSDGADGGKPKLFMTHHPQTTYNSPVPTVGATTTISTDAVSGSPSIACDNNVFSADGFKRLAVTWTPSSYGRKLAVFTYCGFNFTQQGTTIEFDDNRYFGHIGKVGSNAGARFVLTFSTGSSSGQGEATLFQHDTVVTNLTSSNFIGFADGSYSNGQTATIKIIGSISDGHSGLAPGSKIYVQRSGDLSTNSDVPIVVAGTAISSSEILVKS